MHNYCNTENCRYYVGLLYDPAKSSPPLKSQSIVLSVSLIIIIIRFAITGIDRHIFVMSQRSNSGKKCTWEKFSVTFTVICAIKPNSAVQFVVNTLFAIKNQDFFPELNHNCKLKADNDKSTHKSNNNNNNNCFHMGHKALFEKVLCLILSSSTASSLCRL